jgi:hypothetical protein
LRARGVVRTANAPAGDYAEYLVARALGGNLAHNSEKSWDVATPDDKHLQVKCRVVFNPKTPSQRQLSPFRSFDFDVLVVVLFDDAYVVWRALQIPVALVRELAVHHDHVNGSVLFATDAIARLPGVTDMTQVLRHAAEPDP